MEPLDASELTGIWPEGGIHHVLRRVHKLLSADAKQQPVTLYACLQHGSGKLLTSQLAPSSIAKYMTDWRRFWLKSRSQQILADAGVTSEEIQQLLQRVDADWRQAKTKSAAASQLIPDAPPQSLLRRAAGHHTPEAAAGVVAESECILCHAHNDTLVWNGKIRWKASASAEVSTFDACGHLFSPSLSCAYHERYKSIPPVMDFQADTPHKGFADLVWGNAVGDDNIDSELSAGWDPSVVALIPRSNSDCDAMKTLISCLQDKQENVHKEHAFKVARSRVEVSATDVANKPVNHLLGYATIFHNPNGGMNYFLEAVLPQNLRMSWRVDKDTMRTVQRGLLYDSRPACLMTMCWFRSISGKDVAETWVADPPLDGNTMLEALKAQHQVFHQTVQTQAADAQSWLAGHSGVAS